MAVAHIMPACSQILTECGEDELDSAPSRKRVKREDFKIVRIDERDGKQEAGDIQYPMKRNL
jgi:hypothetical protein